MFDDPDAAIQATRDMITLAGADGRHRAVALNLMGRAQLAKGARAEAVQTLLRASAAAGGLTRTIDALDASIRADLGLAALLDGDEKLAHSYLAATGVAQDPGAYLPASRDIGVRLCPSFATQADLVVIEFAVTPEGRPRNIRAIYSNKGGHYASLMSEYATTFRWNPAQVTQLRPFQASQLRLELRCSPAEDGVSEIIDGVEPRFAWLSKLGVAPFDADDATSLAGLERTKAELAARERQHGLHSPHVLPILHVRSNSPLTTFAETIAALERSFRIAESANAPASVSAELLARRAYIETKDDAEILRRLQDLAQSQRYAADPEARGYLNYLIGSASEPPLAEKHLLAAATASELPEAHPIRRAANLQLFYLGAGSKDNAARAKYLAGTGLRLSPCSLATLKRERMPSGQSFPNEAARWGFEGWSVVQFDIDSTGALRNVIPVVSYPPLVFTEAAKRTASTMRYDIRGAVGQDGGRKRGSNYIAFQLR